jgi:hypothetical protein
MSRQLKKAAIVGAVIVVLLALASFATTSRWMDGRFPQGYFQLSLCDTDGKPVKAAVLRVYRGGTRNLAYGYPLANHLPNNEITSDESGHIVAIQKSNGFQFGGHAWELFWVIPMGAQVPEYDCEITAEGFKPLMFPVTQLFDAADNRLDDQPTVKVQVDGKEWELPSYEGNFNLVRK